MEALVDLLKSDSGYFSSSESLGDDEQFPSIIFVPLCFKGFELAIMECDQDKIFKDCCKYTDVQIISCSELEFERSLLNEFPSIVHAVKNACQLALIPFRRYTIVYPRKKFWFAPNFETPHEPEGFSQDNPRVVFVPLCARGSVISKLIDDNEDQYCEETGAEMFPQIICCSAVDFENCLFEKQPELIAEILMACNSNILEKSSEKQYTIMCPKKMWWVRE